MGCIRLIIGLFALCFWGAVFIFLGMMALGTVMAVVEAALSMLP